MVSDNARKTIEALDEGSYLNTREISMGGVVFSARDVVVKVPLIAGLNFYGVGGTGRGKTELVNDLVSYFGSDACTAMGRPDFEPSELMKQVRLDKLKTAGTDRELVELTENVSKCLYFVDELNRCPPIVQNYFFDFFDGKLVHNGKIFSLGKRGYSVGFATGNLGDGEYVGISESDRALLDRMHMIVKLDHPDYRSRPVDMFDVFRSKKNPRADLPLEREVRTGDIIELNREFGGRNVNPILPLVGVYFTEGLDYLENVKGNSKLACDTRWPNIEGIRTDIDEDKVMPLSPRAVFSAMGIAGALEMIAESRGLEVDSVGLFLDGLRLSVPYSGVLSSAYVENESNGNVYEAFDSLFGEGSRNRSDILDKVDVMEEALAFAEAGKRNDSLLGRISERKGRWSAVRGALEDYTDRIAKNPTEESLKLRGIIDKAHEVS